METDVKRLGEKGRREKGRGRKREDEGEIVREIERTC